MLEKIDIHFKRTTKDGHQEFNTRLSPSLTSATFKIDEMPSIVAHRDLIGIVFQNLILNAIKYRSDALPEIEITVEKSQIRHIFSVADNGRGIDAGQADTIFDRYERGNNIKSSDQGMGIGLATCKRIIDYHNGEISVHQRHDKRGTIFKFQIPIDV